MMRGLLRLSAAAAAFACCGTASIFSAPASAQGSYSPYNETATAALTRYLHALASDPKDFTSLIGAGRAALELGDAQAAAAFFARADEVNSRSPLPQAGMGAAQVIAGEAQASLPYFTRAQQLGATLATIGCDRGLAYDLMGRQADAQSDYRAALTGPDGDEARRRLALSLAISGDRNGALSALAPLAAKGDVAAGRTRAFVLALTGDSSGAMAAINAAMPGSSASLAPFLQRLGALQPGQKAAAANLGIFPDSGDTRMASVPSQSYGSGLQVTSSVTTNRLSGIDDLLRPAPPQQQRAYTPQPQVQRAAPPQQVAYARPVAQPAQRPTPAQRKIWLQLASGQNSAALAGQFQQIKSKNRDLFKGIPGYVARSPDRARLVIGPFRSTNDADTFAEDLQTVDVSAFKWSNSPVDQIVPLGTE
jgi:tetratricopeptide (TPR) repeat protein